MFAELDALHIVLLLGECMALWGKPNKPIVQQGMNHDKPYFSNKSGVNMLMFMANYYSFL